MFLNNLRKIFILLRAIFTKMVQVLKCVNYLYARLPQYLNFKIRVIKTRHAMVFAELKGVFIFEKSC